MPRMVRRMWEGQAIGFRERSRTFWHEAFVADPITWIDPALLLTVMEAVAEAERAGVLDEAVGAS